MEGMRGWWELSDAQGNGSNRFCARSDAPTGVGIGTGPQCRELPRKYPPYRTWPSVVPRRELLRHGPPRVHANLVQEFMSDYS